MSRIIVAIGGGENGRICSDGTRLPYETGPMDKEIIKLTGKKHPNFLLIVHGQPLDIQEEYFMVMVDIYEKMYGCLCKNLKSDKLTDKEYVKELLEWADIIYEGGGNTLEMIKLWKETGFDKMLKSAWKDGKVMCGVSAGASCWFKECLTDSLQIKYGSSKPLTKINCLGFIDGLFVPHCDEPGRQEIIKDLLKGSNQIGLSISNCAALEIVDDKYKLIKADGSNYNIESYGLKSYWSDEKYFEENLEGSLEYNSLKDLFAKN